MEELFAGRNFDIDQMMARLRSVADSLGLPLGDRKKTFNSRLAQELGKWAEEQTKGEEFHNAVFNAYFAEGKNIAQLPILVDIATGVGLNGEEASHVINNRTFKDSVNDDWKRSHMLNVSAVPTFLVDDRSLTGAQKYEDLEQLLIQAGVAKRMD